MNIIKFLANQQPICTKFPLFKALEGDFEMYVALSRRSSKEFNENLLGKRCGRYLLCTNECLGRPIPKYPELERYLSNLNNVTEGQYKGKAVWLTKATLCGQCPFKTNCEAPCGTLEDFLNRDTDLHEPLSSKLVALNTQGEDLYVWEELSKVTGFKGNEIPWEALNEMQEKVVKLRIYSNLEYEDIAEQLYITRQMAWKHFKAGLTKLKNYGKSSR